MPDLTVTLHEEKSRYEVHRGETLLGFAAFQRAPELVVFTHTEVFPGSEGQGVGSALVQGALDDVRSTGVRVLPICPFVAGYLQRHPAYADLDYRAPQSKVSD